MSNVGGFSRGFASGVVVSSILYGIYEYLNGSSSHVDEDSQSTKQDELNKVRGKEILKYGIPDRGPDVMYYRNHALCYDQGKRTPLWVAEHLTKRRLKGEANRQRSKFSPDPAIAKVFTATNQDYWKSGWSRGHMAPAGDNKHDQSSMDDTFLLSNIVPQDIKNNAGYWNRLEMYCRDLTERFDDVRVISGPLIIPAHSEDGNRIVKYPVLGKSLVAVPSHLFKIIIAERKDMTALGVFLIPNMDIPSTNSDLQNYQLSMEHLESHAGLKFVPQLNRANTRNLCHVDSCLLTSQAKLEMYMLTRQLENAQSLDSVEKIWISAQELKLKPDKHLTQLYNRKREELSSVLTEDLPVAGSVVS